MNKDQLSTEKNTGQSGHLFVVATPIGNLGDISNRALSVFQKTQLFLCEDTRKTLSLLQKLGISFDPRSVRFERCDEYVSDHQIDKWISFIQEGGQVSLVSDAGTPGISDPGSKIVAIARERDCAVVPVPGPSAVSAFMSVAGCRFSGFEFLGFFPRKKNEQTEAISALSSEKLTLYFESPERIEQTLAFLMETEKVSHLVLAKELTKLHERFWVGTPEQVLVELRQDSDDKIWQGEWVFGVMGAQKSLKSHEGEDWVNILTSLLNETSLPLSEISRVISQCFGVTKRDVYEKGLKIKQKK